MRNLLTYTSLAALAVLSMGQVHAACGGGGYHAPVKTVEAAPAPRETTRVVVDSTVRSGSLDSTRFDSVSSTMELSKGQWKEISSAKSQINDENKKLAKAQSKAQNKLDNCDGDCTDKNQCPFHRALLSFTSCRPGPPAERRAGQTAPVWRRWGR